MMLLIPAAWKANAYGLGNNIWSGEYPNALPLTAWKRFIDDCQPVA